MVKVKVSRDEVLRLVRNALSETEVFEISAQIVNQTMVRDVIEGIYDLYVEALDAEEGAVVEYLSVKDYILALNEQKEW